MGFERFEGVSAIATAASSELRLRRNDGDADGACTFTFPARASRTSLYFLYLEAVV
jgi:hypothetical protein